MGTQKIIWKANKKQRYSPLKQRNGHNLPVTWQSIVLIITIQMGPFIGGWSEGQPGLWWLTLYWIQMSSKVLLNVSINVKLGYKKIISYKDLHLFSKCTVNVTSFIKCDGHQWMYVMDNYSLISLRLGFWHVAALLSSGRLDDFTFFAPKHRSEERAPVQKPEKSCRPLPTDIAQFIASSSGSNRS